MKKIHLVDAVIDFLASDSAGDSKGVYHPEVVKTHLNNAYNLAVYNAWLNGKRYSEFSQLDVWSKSYEVTVSGQIAGGSTAYVLLPFAPVQLPDGMGIRQVRDHDDNDIVFAPIEATANVIFAELEVQTMDDTPTYSLEQNDLSTGAGEESHLLRLAKLPLIPLNITSVDVMMIVPLDQIDDYSEITMPSGAEDILIRQTVELMSKKLMPDTSNDQVISK